MCGLLGYYAWKGACPPLAELCHLTEMLRHRGPDAGGYWTEGPVFLGHRRLSIIDLAQGDQPMASEDGRLVVTFNGEIYNYIELRRELRALGISFQTGSDTEVLLGGYKAWGTGLAERLVGMFAFAIFDRWEKTLYLARDRIGEKPLLYRIANDHVLFASELEPIATALKGQRRLDPVALGAFLCLNYVPGDRTMMENVRRLPAGAWRLYRADGTYDQESYWSPVQSQPLPPGAVSLERAADQLQSHLDRATEIALRSDVPVGLFLSGGIDSSLVAESAARQGRLVQAFCVDMGVPSFSEVDAAKTVAERLGLELVPVSLQPSILESFLDIVSHADDPLADSSALPVWAVSQAASRELKVVLSGDGGDELFGGYLTYKASLVHREFVDRLPGPLRRLLARSTGLFARSGEQKVSTRYKIGRFLRAAELPTDQAHLSWNGTWLPRDAAALCRNPEARAQALQALGQVSGRRRSGGESMLHDLQCLDILEYLPNDILAKVDRTSMAHGLEVRAPLLNPEIVDFALSLPLDLRVGLVGKPKRLLRHLCRRHFGDRIASAPKQGFSIPIHSWLRGPGRELMLDLLSGEALERLTWLDGKAVENAVTQHLKNQVPLGFELWGLMVFSAWHQRWIPGDSGPTCAGLDCELKQVRLAPLRAA